VLKMPEEMIELAEKDGSDFFDYQWLPKLPEAEQEIYLADKQRQISNERQGGL